MLLHVFGHVEAHDLAVAVEELLRERLRQLRLADAGRAEEEERADGAVLVLDAGAGAQDGVGDVAHGLVLADDAAVQLVREAQQLLALALDEARDGDAGPAADDLGDLVLGDLLAEHPGGVGALLGGELGELLLEGGDGAVAELGDGVEVAGALEALAFVAGLRELLADLLHVLDGGLLALPLELHRGGFLLEGGELGAKGGEALLGGGVRLLFERRLLDFEARLAARGLVELGGHRVHLDADRGAGLVHEVDRLVGEEAVGDVAVGEDGGRDEGGVLDPDVVVQLEAVAQAAQDGDRVLDGGRVDGDGLEAALERGVLLHVEAVFVERRGADAVQLAAREHGLEHVGGVGRALGLAGADDGVDLVDEEQDAPLGGLDLLKDRLEPLLELAAVLRAGHERGHVEREDRAALERLGDVAAHDALREALDDGGLADAGLADEDRVVLRLAREDARHGADLRVAADHGVELAGLREGDEVRAVLLERLVLLLGRVARDVLVAADGLEGREDGALRDARAAQRLGDAGRLRLRDHREEDVLDAHVFVAHAPGGLLRGGEDAGELLRDVDLALLRRRAGAGDGRDAREQLLRLRAEVRGGGAGLLDDARREAVLLGEKGGEDVRRVDRLVVAARGLLLGGLQRLLNLLGKIVVHG